MKWKFIGREGKYRFWESDDIKPIYQVTTNDDPPVNDGGYYNLDYLLKVKCCSITRLDKKLQRL